jgi:hypothetical protein
VSRRLQGDRPFFLHALFDFLKLHDATRLRLAGPMKLKPLVSRTLGKGNQSALFGRPRCFCV